MQRPPAPHVEVERRHIGAILGRIVGQTKESGRQRRARRIVGGDEPALAVAESMAVLDRITAVATTSELQPGEYPALLSGPDRVEVYGVTDVFGRVQEARR